VSVLYLTVFIDLVGFGIIFPVLPFYAQAFGASAQEITLLVSTYSAMQLVSAPVWGRLSDRYGRKWILVLTLAGGAASYAWFGFADSLLALFLARALSGVMAGHFAVAHAYVADMTAPQARGAAMGKLGAAVGLGFVAGPAIGGLLGEGGPALACLVGAAISGIAALMGAALLREPERRGARMPADLRIALAALGNREFALRCGLLMGVTFVFSQAMSLFPLWAQARFAWGPAEAGAAFAAIGLIMAAVQGVAVPRLSRRAGDWRLLATGAGLLGAGLAVTMAIGGAAGVAAQVLVVGVGMALASPSVSALASRAAPAEHQGSAMGASSAAGSFGRIVGPPFAGFVFTHAGVDWPFTLSGLALLPLAAFALGRARRRSAVAPA
jgi:MFS transporter, DHA1 family, tetracycline resistance protein